ncbi:Lysylphosphatidylglycerol synthetase, C-terminal domain, DUF2156 family [Klenkia marina]|uniref:Lysylphosphatidylglycerol synthetase, C-terminal domain, DUF2156 family n=1 Tax=Klenkia marina TaxID=1960309 RepID=A0A1G4XVP0_9ACTN|nr:Lysylphosphatidylglycerol synthetase, C-terminal domain, DUF2156 family [Klenkia marina]
MTVVGQGRWVRRVSALVALVVGVASLAAVVAVVPHPHRRPVPGLRPFEGAVAAVEGGRYLLLGAGLVLLLVVRALLRGRRAAWLAAVAALAAAAVGSLVVHRHWPVSILLAVLTAGVGLGGRAFVARGDPMLVRRGIAVLAGGSALVGTVATVGLYQLDDQFRGGTTFWGSVADAARLLLMLPVDEQPLTRHAGWLVSASRGAALAVVLVGAAMLVAAVSGGRQRQADRAAVAALLERYATTSLAHFQLLPDKRWLVGADGEAFVGYGLHGRTAVALGGPIGAPGSRRAVAEEFLELCRRNGWTPGFHQVTEAELADLEPLGLRAYKIGDEAVVPLDGAVAPEGRAGKSIRSAVRRCERAGYRVVELAHPLTDADLDRLREVSDAWSADGEHRERTFTLGQFDAEQLRQTPVLAVVDADGRVQAFANTLPTHQGRERSFDLMRRRPGSVNGVMDQLFIGMGERFAAAGATGMNLGLAPFTGLADQPGVPARVMRALYDHGGVLLDYPGLRAFKGKWAPRWEPRYLVTSGDSALPRVAVAVARLGELPDPRSPLVRAGSLVRRFPVTTAFVAVQLWLMLSSAYDPAVHQQLFAAAGSSWDLLAHGQLWRLLTSPVVQASPGLAWVNVLLAVVVPVAEARFGSRWAAVGFFAGDLLGSVPVVVGLRVAAAVGSGAALDHLREVDGGTSAGCWALVAALVVGLPAGRLRRGAGGALALAMAGGILLDRGIADVQHAVSVVGVVLVLTVGRHALDRARAARRARGSEAGQQRDGEDGHHRGDHPVEHPPGGRPGEHRSQGPRPEPETDEPDDAGRARTGGEPPAVLPVGAGDRAQQQHGVQVDVRVQPGQRERGADHRGQRRP